ncbi:MAG: FKBP-type peptidyl-prolyl cis-trans isomerase [Gemmatimonadaceae bacterium]
MRLRRLAVVLSPLAFAACLSGTDYSTNTYPNIPIEQTTFAPALNVDLTQSIRTSTGLYYRDLTVGTGATATSTSAVNAYYVLYFANGQKVQELASPSTPLSFTLGQTPAQVIPGWEEGLVGMKAGGTRQLIIPPALAYGASGLVSPAGVLVIPPYAVLVYTVKLESIS